MPLRGLKFILHPLEICSLGGLSLWILAKGWLEGAKLGTPQTSGFHVTCWGKANEF